MKIKQGSFHNNNNRPRTKSRSLYLDPYLFHICIVCVLPTWVDDRPIWVDLRTALLSVTPSELPKCTLNLVGPKAAYTMLAPQTEPILCPHRKDEAPKCLLWALGPNATEPTWDAIAHTQQMLA